MAFCVKSSEIDESIHVIISGPYDSNGQCAEGCGSSSRITVMESEAFTAENSPGQVYFRARMSSQDGSPIFWYTEGERVDVVDGQTTYRFPSEGFDSVESGNYFGASIRLENCVSGSEATFRVYVQDEEASFLLISLSAQIP